MLGTFLKGATAAKPPIISTFRATSVDAANRSTYTFPSQSLGVAFTGRIVVVAVTSFASSTYSVAGVTVGGVSATKVNSNGNATSELCALFAVQLDTGTSADVVVTFTTTVSCCGIAVWTLENAQNYSVEAVPNAINNLSNAASITTSFASVSKGDAIIVVSRIRSANVGSYSLSGATEDFQMIVESGISGQHGGSVDIDADASNYDVIISTSGSSPATSYTVTRFFK